MDILYLQKGKKKSEETTFWERNFSVFKKKWPDWCLLSFCLWSWASPESSARWRSDPGWWETKPSGGWLIKTAAWLAFKKLLSGERGESVWAWQSVKRLHCAPWNSSGFGQRPQKPEERFGSTGKSCVLWSRGQPPVFESMVVAAHWRNGVNPVKKNPTKKSLHWGFPKRLKWLEEGHASKLATQISFPAWWLADQTSIHLRFFFFFLLTCVMKWFCL